MRLVAATVAGLPAASLLAVALSGAAAAQALVLPAETAADPKLLWSEVMTSLYGPYDRARKCWVGRESGTGYCMRPHRLERVAEGGAERLFVAVGGARLDETGCHACAGNMGLFVLDRRPDGSFELKSGSGRYVEFGSWGRVPDEEFFQVERIGPDAHAWVIESGYTAQGYTAAGKSIFAPRGGTVAEIGHIPTYMDECGSGREPCSTYELNLTFEAGAGTEYFDAVLRLAPDSDVPPLGNSFTIPFDATRGEYAVPEELAELMSV